MRILGMVAIIMASAGQSFPDLAWWARHLWADRNCDEAIRFAMEDCREELQHYDNATGVLEQAKEAYGHAKELLGEKFGDAKHAIKKTQRLLAKEEPYRLEAQREHYLLMLDVPGFPGDQLELTLNGHAHQLRVHGETHEDNWHRQIDQIVSLPADADLTPGSMEAVVHQGVLRIRVPIGRNGSGRLPVKDDQHPVTTLAANEDGWNIF